MKGFLTFLLCLPLGACGGAPPLLHGSQVLPEGVVRGTAGFAAEFSSNPLAAAVASAREAASEPSSSASSPDRTAILTRGVLSEAALSPGLGPVFSVRVGLGSDWEAGATYGGQTLRIDGRRSFSLGSKSGLSLSGGVAARVPIRLDSESSIPGLDLKSLRGVGVDVPLLLGWESAGGLYRAWFGGRGGWAEYRLTTSTSEPKQYPLFPQALSLSASQWFVGPLVGFAVGFTNIHFALELEVDYQAIEGRANGVTGQVHGLSFAPSSGLWFTL